MKQQSRITYIDTMRGLLIFLVVLGHMISQLKKFSSDYTFLSSLFFIIHTFHMPAMIFISGYCSKRSDFSKGYVLNQITNILIPFIIFHGIHWIVFSRHIHSLFNPSFTLWYLLCLFCWRIMIIPFSKFRFPIIISIALSLLVGFSDAGHLLSLSRMIAFFPFFVLGYRLNKSTLDRCRSVNKLIPILSIILLLSFSLIAHWKGIASDALLFDRPYESNFGLSNSIISRVFALFVGFAFTFTLICLLPDKESFVSRLGKSTMVIYLTHSLVIRLIKKLPTIMSINEPLFFISAILLSILICFIFSRPAIIGLYSSLINKISSLVIKKEETV